MWGLLVAAAVPLFVATGAAAGVGRARLDARARRLGRRVGPGAVLPRHVGARARSRVSRSPRSDWRVALGIGVSVLVDGIRTFRFGWRQPAAILGGVAVLLPVLAFTADVVDGRWHAPGPDWDEDARVHRVRSPTTGEFRMLWVGDPSVLPLDPVVLHDGTGYTLTRNGPGDVTELSRAPRARRRPRRRSRDRARA